MNKSTQQSLNAIMVVVMVIIASYTILIIFYAGLEYNTYNITRDEYQTLYNKCINKPPCNLLLGGTAAHLCTVDCIKQKIKDEPRGTYSNQKRIQKSKRNIKKPQVLL